jgi:Cyclomaltodextrinase, N-terminal
MLPFRRAIACTVLAASFCLSAAAQLQPEPVCNAAPAGGAPCVYQVDPLDWWTGMPPPMLLLYGRNLKDALITVTGSHVSTTKTQFSAVGHFAFVWFDDANSAPQTLEIRVATAQGQATARYYRKKTVRTVLSTAKEACGQSCFYLGIGQYLGPILRTQTLLSE